MIAWLRRLFGCKHRDMYRERRRLHGVLILHFVCENCGHAAPAIDRSATEHRHMVKRGAVRRPKGKHQMPADVVRPKFGGG